MAVALRVALAPLFGMAAPFVTCFAAAIALAWFCGFWPSVLSIVASRVIIGEHFILGVKGFSGGGAANATAAAFVAFLPL